MDEPIAIVGLGGVFPDAPSAEDLWPLVEQGRDAAREVPPGRWPVPPAEAFDPMPGRADRLYSTRGCFISGFELDARGLAVDLQRCDPSVTLAVHAGAQAWRSARMDAVDRRRVGVVLGNIVLPTQRASALASWVLGERDVTGPPPSGWDRFVAGLPAGAVAAALELGGEQLCLDAACASSLFAIHHAVAALRAGRADAVLAGGVSRPDCFYTQMGFSQLRALSARGRCAPFDARGDGLVVGEGAGVVVLKRLADARAHGDRIWAVVRGVGLSNDVAGKLLAPSCEGQLRAMRSAYRQASWTPAQVQYVECHATGTPVGDAVEFASLSRLREGAPPCPIGAVKANVGHLLTAAGAVALVKVLLAMDRGVVPPVANFERASERLAVDGAPIRIPTAAEVWNAPVRRAAVSGLRLRRHQCARAPRKRGGAGGGGEPRRRAGGRHRGARRRAEGRESSERGAGRGGGRGWGADRGGRRDRGGAPAVVWAR